MDEPILSTRLPGAREIRRLPSVIISNLVERSEYLPHFLMATIEGA